MQQEASTAGALEVQFVFEEYGGLSVQLSHQVLHHPEADVRPRCHDGAEVLNPTETPPSRHKLMVHQHARSWGVSQRVCERMQRVDRGGREHSFQMKETWRKASTQGMRTTAFVFVFVFFCHFY